MQQLKQNTTLQGGKYRIERVLGQGGFGNTYEGVNTVFDERVAIKEFFMQGINNRDENTGSVSVSLASNRQQFEDQREKFKKEALRIRKFNNPHIIKVHDLFEENGTAYYVMDFVDGESLAERMKRTGKPMSVQEVESILSQILDALKTVHEAGIWHLDLKPANIMIDKFGNIQLIDFGASKQLNAQKGGATTSTAISFTNGYAPREQMEQNYDKFGPWTDFYSLGATLYTLLSNRRPPLPTDIDDDMSEDKHQALPMQTGINKNMHDLILWLMKTNRNQRPQSIKEIENWLKQPETLHFSKKIIEGHSAKTDRTFNVGGFSVTLDELLEKAFDGDDESLDSLNQLFEDKSISNKEKEKVFFLVKKKAEQGNDGAILIIGNCFYSGEGVTINQTEAVRWYKLAAENGNAVAEYALGSCYANGEGVPENKEEAVRWYRLAAEQGLPDAQFMIGTCYTNGEGVLEDKVEAVRWYKLAAEQRYAYAQLLLGLCYLNGDGVTEDKAEAVRLFRMASEQDNEFAMLQIGLCYYNGIEVSENKTEAVKWFKKAAEKGESEAQYYLGCCYSNGEGVPENKEEAVQWYRLAAGQGVADAQYELGCLYNLGEGVQENHEEAYKWFKLAADNGHNDAIELLNCKSASIHQNDNSEETITSPVEKQKTQDELINNYVYSLGMKNGNINPLPKQNDSLSEKKKSDSNISIFQVVTFIIYYGAVIFISFFGFLFISLAVANMW